MARKTDSIFIRKTLNIGNAEATQETSIDLGAFVDPLGKSVVRLLSVQVGYTAADSTVPYVNDDKTAAAQWQLTTQAQGAMVMISDKSVIAGGVLIASGVNSVSGGNHVPETVDSELNLDPLGYTNGYLIGVEQIYLAGRPTIEWTNPVHVSVVLEIVVETLTAAKAVALAMSQQ